MIRNGWALILVIALGGCADDPTSGVLEPPRGPRVTAPSANGEVVAVDLGTLRSDVMSWAFDVNDRGQIVGRSRDDVHSGSMHCFIWESGRMTDLGHLGGTECEALGINATGAVVGYSNVAGGQAHAFLWQAGGMQDLGTYPGETSSRASKINSPGQVIGTSGSRGVLWDNGQVIDLGFFPSDINDLGQIVGQLSIPGEDPAGILWQSGSVVSLGDFLPRAIDESGRMAGMQNGVAVVWENGVTTPLPHLSGFGSPPSFPAEMNDVGQVVGTSNDPGPHAALWENGAVLDLGFLPSCGPTSCGSSQAWGINEGGLVVGVSQTGETVHFNGEDLAVAHATLWVIGAEDPGAEIAGLVDDTKALGLAAGIERGLVAKLEAAGKLEAQGSGMAAAHLLEAFALELEALVQNGTLGAAEAQPLTDQARMVALQLGA